MSIAKNLDAFFRLLQEDLGVKLPDIELLTKADLNLTTATYPSNRDMWDAIDTYNGGRKKLQPLIPSGIEAPYLKPVTAWVLKQQMADTATRRVPIQTVPLTYPDNNSKPNGPKQPTSKTSVSSGRSSNKSGTVKSGSPSVNSGVPEEFLLLHQDLDYQQALTIINRWNSSCLPMFRQLDQGPLETILNSAISILFTQSSMKNNHQPPSDSSLQQRLCSSMSTPLATTKANQPTASRQQTLTSPRSIPQDALSSR